MFTKTTFEEDVRVTLGEVLKRNGLEVIFKPGVEGVVTFEFSNMPLQAVFNKLLDENSLSYSFDGEHKMVTIAKADDQTVADEIFTPRFAKVAELLRAMGRFKVAGEGVELKLDDDTDSIFIHGGQNKVKALREILVKIDDAYKNRREKEVSVQQSVVDERRRALDTKAIETAISNAEVEVAVIPLRYASVDATTSSYLGQSVRVPGIVDSLKVFVGSMKIEDGTKPSTINIQSGSEQRSLEIGAPPPPVVSVDQRTNSVIVQGTPTQVAKIREVIERLDQPVPLVEIEVMIVNGTDDLSRQLGIGWGVEGNVGQNAANKATQQATGTAVLPTAAATAGYNLLGAMDVVSSTTSGLGASFIYRGTREVLNAKLTALAKESNMQTVAAPRVVTLNNMAAKITNSTSINIPVSVGDNKAPDLKTVSAGVTMDITPSVIRDVATGAISLRMMITANNTSVAPPVANNVTTEGQQVQTNVIMPEGGTLILGGLFNTVRSEIETGIPGLKDIPILGALFRTREAADTKKETVFFITPKVHESNNLAKLVNSEMHDYIQTKRGDLNKSQRHLMDSKHLDLKKSRAEDE